MPAPAGLVVKNGSNRCLATSSSMPMPVSRDGEQHVRAGRAVAVGGDLRLVDVDVGGLDRQRAAAGHRVAGVGGEVEDHALDLRAVGLDRRELGREPDADADVVADDALQHRLHAGDDLVEVDDARVQDLAAAEGEQLVRQRGGLARRRARSPRASSLPVAAPRRISA